MFEIAAHHQAFKATVSSFVLFIRVLQFIKNREKIQDFSFNVEVLRLRFANIRMK